VDQKVPLINTKADFRTVKPHPQ